jgi:hypothetical protein
VKKLSITPEQAVVAQTEMLKDMFIADLVIAGVPQLQIAKVVRVNLNRVNRIGKCLKKRTQGSNGEN